jgi:hypothetical protein
VTTRRAEQKPFLVRRDAGGGDVGVQRLGERVMARHHVLLAAFLVQPDQPARALRLQVLHPHLQRRPNAGKAVGEGVVLSRYTEQRRICCSCFDS